MNVAGSRHEQEHVQTDDIEDGIEDTTNVPRAVADDNHCTQTSPWAEGGDEGRCYTTEGGKADYSCGSMPRLGLSTTRYRRSETHGRVRVKMY